ncbi:hypothetical protein K501DRAFT_338117 [Backusella circina FSU 941]|nr:hypothetical protein K501DRAFT_338117 [Backusella circina FSU 941]
MLPQFGYIIAQAGADSLAPPPPLPQQQPPSLPPQQQQQQPSSLAPLLNSNKPFILPYSTQSMSHNHNYIQRAPSPSIPPPSVLPPPPPPQQQQQNPYLYASSFVPHSPTQKKLNNNNHKNAPMMPYNYNSSSGTDDIMMNDDDNDDGILTEYNDLMTWMDNEFREQAEKIYNEKLNDLQLELQGTHSAFSDAIEEFELIREKSITDATYFMNYQLSFIEHDYDTYVVAVEEEYESEKKQLIENLLLSLQEKKKQAKEEDEDAGRTKRSLRKRNLESSTAATLKTESIANNKKRAVRTSTLPNIHTISADEEEELEAEFINLKLLITKQ